MFSTDTPVSRNSNRECSMICNECLYGHHIVAPAMECGIFRCRKPRSRPYWWPGGTLKPKYILNCEAVPNVSTVTSNFAIYTEDLKYLLTNSHLSFVWLVLRWQMVLHLSEMRNLLLLTNWGLPLGKINAKRCQTLHPTSLFEWFTDQKPGAKWVRGRSNQIKNYVVMGITFFLL